MSNGGRAKIWTVRLSEGTFVGIVDLGLIANGEADIGFMIRRDHWGKSYAFGACMLVIMNAHAMKLQAAQRAHPCRQSALAKTSSKTGLLAGRNARCGDTPGRDEAMRILRAG